MKNFKSTPGFKTFLLFLAVSLSGIAYGQYLPNTIRIKFKDTMVKQLQAFDNNKIQPTSDGYVRTGMPSFDRLSEKYRIKMMKRVFRPAGQFETRHQKHGLHLWYELDLSGISSAEVEKSITEFSKIQEIKTVERIYDKTLYGQDPPVTPTFIPNEPFFPLQWHYNNTGQTGGTPGSDIRLVDAWDIQQGSSNVIVAVIDGGIDVAHEDLSAAIWVNEVEQNGTQGIDDDGNGYIDDINGYGFGDNIGNFAPDNHGSHVAGTIGAINNNGIGVSGIAGGSGTADGVRLMSCAVFGVYGGANFDDAFVYAADMGAVIAQNSWGYTSPGAFEQSVLDAIDYFIANAGIDINGNQVGPMAGGLVIFAAGNGNSDMEWYPGYYSPVLSVSSINHNSQKSYYSNFGSWVDVAAPGGETIYNVNQGVLSTVAGNQYGYMQGTSMACPHVSGLAALVLSEIKGPGVTPVALRNRIVSRTDNIDDLNPSFTGLLGSGRINAVNSLIPPDDIPPAAITDLQIAGIAATSAILSWTATGGSNTTGFAKNYEIRYATFSINDGNFGTASLVQNPPIPKIAGTPELFTVTGLSTATNYYFAIKAIDYDGYISGISNVVSGETEAAPLITISADNFIANLNLGDTISQFLTVGNVGAANLIMTIKPDPVIIPTMSFASTAKSEHLEILPDLDLNNMIFTNKGVNLVQNGVSQNQIIYSDNFEFGLGGWTTEVYTIDDLWHRTTLNYSSEVHSWYCGLDNLMNYATPNIISTAAVSPEIDLSSVISDSLFLIFAESYNTEPGWDYCMVDISTDEGTTWTPLRGGYGYAPSGNSGGWKATRIDISSYIGSNIKIRFYFDTKDQYGNNLPGWFFDDILISTSANTASWLTVEPNSAIIPVGSDESFRLHYDAGEVTMGGDYYAHLALSSNDPDQPLIFIPVRMHVPGDPMISLQADTLSFGQVFAGTADTLSFAIHNEGRDVLSISSIYSTDSHFGVNIGAAYINYDSEIMVKVWYNAADIKQDTGSLYILSDDPEYGKLRVFLEGESVYPPVISVLQDSIFMLLKPGEKDSINLSINNQAGGSDLLLTLRKERNNQQLTYLPSAAISSIKSTDLKSTDQSAVPEKTIAGSEILIIQDKLAWNVDMSSFILNNFGLYSDLINSASIDLTDFSHYKMIITTGDQYSTYYSSLTYYLTKFEEFIQNGGLVQYQLATQGDNVSLAGGAQLIYGSQDFYNVSVMPEHPILKDIPQVIYGTAANHCYLDPATLPQGTSIITTTQSSGMPTTVEYALGKGRVIVTGMTWEFLYNFGFESGKLLLNAANYSFDYVDLHWLQMETSQLVIPAGASSEIKVVLDARDLDVDEYYAAIRINSNDPLTPQVVVPVHLSVDTVTYIPHFVPVWWPGNGMDHMNLYALTATLDNVPLQPGDEIGVFDGDVCVGTGVLSEVLDGSNYLDCRVSRDDPDTPLKDGYTPDNTITYKVWDASAVKEVNNVQVDYVYGEGIFAPGATSTFNLSALNSITQNISLATNWNIMSFAAEPDNMSMISIVNPLITDATLLKIQDEKGNAIEKLPPPIGWVDNIGLMKLSDGYKIKVAGNVTLSVTGKPVSLPYTISLDANWNIMGYPSMDCQPALTVFNPLITAGTLLKVQDEKGNAIEKLPPPIGWIDNVKNLCPGEGYKVKVSTNTSITINDAGPSTLKNAENAENHPVHFIPVYSNNGLDHMNIYLKGTDPRLSDLKAGDEIGVFDGGLCVGAVLVDNPGKEYQQIIASSDDPTTEEIDGFREGRNLELRLWDYQEGLEKTTQEMVFFEGYNKLFEKQGTTVLAADFKTMASTFLGDAFPNPSRDKTTFTFQLDNELQVRLEIYDIAGNLINILVDKRMPGGMHVIEWDNSTSAGNRASAGVYFYRFKLDNYLQTKKLVIQ